MAFVSQSHRSALSLAMLVAIFLAHPWANARQFVERRRDVERMDRIRTSLERQGKVRIIVRTAGSEVSSGTPTQTLPTESIGRAQDAVAALVPKALSGSIRRYRAAPFLALTVDRTTFEGVAASAAAEDIFEDILLEPSLYGSGPLVGATATRVRGYTGGGWSIAVLDTGVDEAHPFLSNKVVAEGCWDSGTVSCPGSMATSTAPGSGVACGGMGCDHGTHVAGIASGNGAAAGVAFSGIAPDASLISLRVFDTNGASAYLSDVDAALQHVYDLRQSYRIAAVNLSLGSSTGYSTTCDAVAPSTKAMIDQLRTAGIPTIVASGNGGFSDALSVPACISTAISVGSTVNTNWGVTDTVSWFSNSASFLSLLAPGQAISSSIRGGGYGNLQGTSMAAPHVAGAWAVLKQASPGLSVTDALQLLRSSGKPILDPRNGITASRLQIDDAIFSITPAPDLQPILMNYNGDGFRDVLLYNRANGNWTIELGTSTGQFIDGPSGGWLTGWDIRVGDFNGDGLDDLFLYSPQTGLWYKAINNGLGFNYFSQGWQGGFNVFTADLNGDGKSDVFVYNPVTGIWFTCISSGDGTSGFDYGTGQWAPGWKVLPADFDGDGRTDFLLYDVGTGAYYKAITRGNGVFAYTSFTSAPGGAWAPGWTPIILDLNGDRHSDVFLYNVVTGLWYRCVSTGDGTADFTYTSGQWAPGWTVLAADFDGDGKGDLFLYRADGLWYKALNTGTDFTYTVGMWGKWTIIVSDLNGDQRSDVFLYDSSTGTCYQAFTTSATAFTYTRTQFH